MRADHVVVEVAVEFDAQRAVVQADFFEDAVSTKRWMFL